MKIIRIAVAVIVALSSVARAQSTLSPEALLKAAMNRELVDRDFAGAIEQYKKIASTYPSNHPVASKALLQLGGIYERLGNADARAAYLNIVNNYSDTGATFTTARARLTAIQEAVAGPFKVKSLDAFVRNAGGVSVSPDGKYLAYSREKVPNKDGTPAPDALYLREISTGRERILLDAKPGQGIVTFFKWSPDSQRGAIVISMPAGFFLHAITLATRADVVLGKTGNVGPGFVWSPDSRRLAYFTKSSREAQWELHVALLDTGAIDTGALGQFESSRTAPTFAWSPDSRRLAFGVSEPNGDSLRIVTVGSSEAASIPVKKASSTHRTDVRQWTTKGDIAFVQDVPGGNDFFVVSASGGSPKKVCEGRAASGGDGCSALSADGTWQVIRQSESSGGRLLFRNLADGTERSLTPEAVFEQPAGGFSPDGRLFAFRSNRDGGYAVYVAPADRLPAAHPLRVATLESEGSTPIATWTNSGLSLHVTNNQTNLYRVDLDPRTHKPAGPPIRLTQDSPINRTAFASPDNRRIAYVSRGRPSASGIALMDANGTRERVVKEMPPALMNQLGVLGWQSADDLLVSVPEPRGLDPNSSSKRLGTLTVSTGNLRTQSGPALPVGGITFAANAGTIYYSIDGNLKARAASGGSERPIALPDSWENFAVSSDGHWLVYTTTDYPPNKPAPGEIRLRSLDSGAERMLAKYADTRDGSHGVMAFSPDAKLLLYRDPSLVVRIMNIETTDSWALVADATPDADFTNFPDATWSPDGSFIVIEGELHKSTWRLFEGVTFDAVIKLLAGARK